MTDLERTSAIVTQPLGTSEPRDNGNRHRAARSSNPDERSSLMLRRRALLSIVPLSAKVADLRVSRSHIIRLSENQGTQITR